MKTIPETENPLVLRTDFSNQKVWDSICAAIRKPAGLFRFRANMDFLDDRKYSSMTTAQILAQIPPKYNHPFIMIVDQITVTHEENPLLVINLLDDAIENEFRTLPSQVQGIENNLSIANMDFEEFSESVDEDGIFRGFPK